MQKLNQKLLKMIFTENYLRERECIIYENSMRAKEKLGNIVKNNDLETKYSSQPKPRVLSKKIK